MNKKTELLAPAGNYEAFLAAVENGADAVYLGGKMLNARQSAGNFDNEELERALDYAHARGVKVLLTLNTLVLDDELQEAVEYAAKVYEMGADAFIVQDMGLAARLKKAVPGIALHASTQMTAYDLEGVRALENMGFERVVLARELGLEEIGNICGHTSLDIEVFIHGALCISYSGQCLMSSMIGGRSGNRGKCAQPCRLPYTISRDGKNIKSGYLMSPKDICYVDHLAELVRAGVSSLKIEGRMKSPEYVASVVGIYRKYLDAAQEYVSNDGNEAQRYIGNHGDDTERYVGNGRDEAERQAGNDGDENEKCTGAGRTEKGRNIARDMKAQTRPEVSGEDMHRLLQSFNRGGFSNGYLKGKTGPDMMSYDKPKNWGTYLGTVLAGDRGTNSVKLRLENTLGNGDGIEIWSGGAFEESPGGIITKIVRGGQQVKRANGGDTVWVSVIKGRVEQGSKVYKTSDREMLEQAAASYTKATRRLDVEAEFTLRAGQPPVLTLSHSLGMSVTVSGEVLPEKAVNKPLTEERISEQLKKMGSTPFNVTALKINMDGDILVPVSELNNIRRKAAGLLEDKIILSGKRKIEGGINGNMPDMRNNSTHTPGDSANHSGDLLNSDGNRGYGRHDSSKTKLSAIFYRLDKELDLSRLNADRLYIPFDHMLNPDIAGFASGARDMGKEVYAYIPAIIRGRQAELIEKNIHEVAGLADGFLAGNPGVAEMLGNRLGQRVKIMGDYTLNVLNSASLNFLKGAGYCGAALSYELNLAQLEAMDLPAGFDTEAGVYGRIPVMTSEYCPVGASVGNAGPDKCKKVCKNGLYHLKDRKNAAFPVLCDCVDCRSTIFNSDVLFVPELLNRMAAAGLEYLRLGFVDESPQEIYDILDLHRDITANGTVPDNDIIIEKIKAKGFTKGHLQRGV